MDTDNTHPRFRTRAEAEAFGHQLSAMADTPTEASIARLAGRWARWHHRWRARPTTANDQREQRSWDALREALSAAGMEGTWLDPLS